MKNQLKLTCKDFISVNHYMSYRSVSKGKSSIVMAYKPKATKDFERSFGKYLKEEIKKQGWIKPDKGKFIMVDMVFYFPKTNMDASNHNKSLFDCMTLNDVWEDDNIVLERVNRIYYDSKNPHIDIIVTEAEHIGIFDDIEEYTCFVNTYCDNCTKGKKIGQKGGCSVYRQALESRIQEDIDMGDTENNIDKKCFSFKENK